MEEDQQNNELHQTVDNLREQLMQVGEPHRQSSEGTKENGDQESRQVLEQITDGNGAISHRISSGGAQAQTTIQNQSQEQIQIGAQVIAQIRAQVQLEVQAEMQQMQQKILQLKKELNEEERTSAARFLQIEDLKGTADYATRELQYQKDSVNRKINEAVEKKEHDMNSAAREYMGGEQRGIFIANRARQRVEKQRDRLLEENEQLKLKVQELEKLLEDKTESAAEMQIANPETPSEKITVNNNIITNPNSLENL